MKLKQTDKQKITPLHYIYVDALMGIKNCSTQRTMSVLIKVEYLHRVWVISSLFRKQRPLLIYICDYLLQVRIIICTIDIHCCNLIIFQAAVMSLLLYGCIAWILTKRLGKKAWWEQRKNATRCFEQIQEAATPQNSSCTMTCVV